MTTNNSFTVITDAKFDDVLALTVLFLNIPDDSVVDIIVTNVVNLDGAKTLVEHVINELHCQREISVSFYKGVIPLDNEPKSHEDMFKNFKNSKNPWQTTRATMEGHAVFALAPCPAFLSELQTAETVFIGLGYNSNDFSLNDILSFKHVVVMNNVSETVYPKRSDNNTREGGRFSTNDKELWQALSNISPIFNTLREYALKDSVRFISRQIQKVGKKHNKVVIIDENDILSENTLAIAKELYTKDPSPYLGRCVDQLERGEIQVECTDGQHMALWLFCKCSKVTLVDKGYISVENDVNTEQNVFSPTNLTTEMTRDYFVMSLKI